MASYSFNLIDDGNGNFTATGFRAPTTAASGGTSLAGAGDSKLSTSTKMLYKKIIECLAVAVNDRATNG